MLSKTKSPRFCDELDKPQGSFGQLLNEKQDAKIRHAVPAEHYRPADITLPELVEADVAINGRDYPDQWRTHLAAHSRSPSNLALHSQ